MWSNGSCDNGNSILYYIKLNPKVCLKNEFVTREKRKKEGTHNVTI